MAATNLTTSLLSSSKAILALLEVEEPWKHECKPGEKCYE
jgi:hypothetical protein